MSPKRVFPEAETEETPIGTPEVAVINEPRVKQLVRFIGPFTGPDVTAIQDVDKQLSDYINAGWKLFNSHFLSIDVEGHYRMLYVLTKD